MKVRMTFEFNREFRRDLARRYGEKGLASHATLKAWIDSVVTADAEDVSSDAEERDE